MFSWQNDFLWKLSGNVGRRLCLLTCQTPEFPAHVSPQLRWWSSNVPTFARVGLEGWQRKSLARTLQSSLGSHWKETCNCFVWFIFFFLISNWKKVPGNFLPPSPLSDCCCGREDKCGPEGQVRAQDPEPISQGLAASSPHLPRLVWPSRQPIVLTVGRSVPPTGRQSLPWKPGCQQSR